MGVGVGGRGQGGLKLHTLPTCGYMPYLPTYLPACGYVPYLPTCGGMHVRQMGRSFCKLYGILITMHEFNVSCGERLCFVHCKR